MLVHAGVVPLVHGPTSRLPLMDILTVVATLPSNTIVKASCNRSHTASRAAAELLIPQHCAREGRVLNIDYRLLKLSGLGN